MKRNRAALTLLVLIFFSSIPAEDEKIREKVFLSKDNQIIKVSTPIVGGTRYLALSFKNRLDGKNSKGRATDEKSNFGDSASTYCYKKETDISEMEQLLVVEWFKGGGPLNVLYSCGEQLEEERRKAFQGFAETNCLCLEFTFKPMSTTRGMWR